MPLSEEISEMQTCSVWSIVRQRCVMTAFWGHLMIDSTG